MYPPKKRALKYICEPQFKHMRGISIHNYWPIRYKDLTQPRGVYMISAGCQCIFPRLPSVSCFLSSDFGSCTSSVYSYSTAFMNEVTISLRQPLAAKVALNSYLPLTSTHTG